MILKTLFANGIIVTHIQRVLEKFYNPSTGHLMKKPIFMRFIDGMLMYDF